MFLCSNINMQFYSLLRWMNKTAFNPKVTNIHGQDPLFGNRSVPNASNTFEFEANSEKVVLNGLQAFVRTQGVLILFLPSLQALDRLSRSP